MASMFSQSGRIQDRIQPAMMLVGWVSVSRNEKLEDWKSLGRQDMQAWVCLKKRGKEEERQRLRTLNSLKKVQRGFQGLPVPTAAWSRVPLGPELRLHKDPSKLSLVRTNPWKPDLSTLTKPEPVSEDSCWGSLAAGVPDYYAPCVECLQDLFSWLPCCKKNDLSLEIFHFDKWSWCF